MMEQWNSGLFTVFLSIAAWQDVRRKSIDTWLYVVFGMAAVGLRLWGGTTGYGAFWGMMVGGGLLLLSRLTEGSIGDGDGFFFIISGIFLGLWKNIQLFLYGLSLCGLGCLVFFICGLCLGGNPRKETVPFLPFLVPIWLGMVFL